MPVTQDEAIRLGHGSGGVMMQHLLRDVVFPHIANQWTSQGHDSATLAIGNSKVVFTTDSFVVSPLFFPGGDIGELAVYGTVNDLAMSGARPLYLSCSLILEEGLSLSVLERVMQSMARAAAVTGVQLVTGDTKVVERGKGDGLFINTSGIGLIEHSLEIAPQRIDSGDSIILSGDVGRHGMAIMASREGLEFEMPLASDCAPLQSPVLELLAAGVEVHCLRDLTRGGLATALVELAESSGRELAVQEAAVPVTESVQGACELLGLDPFYVANEGRFVAFVPREQAALALAALAKNPLTRGSAVIGNVTEGTHAQVILQNSLGSERLLDRLPGEMLPRIC
ncbi:hydrogenase expression/formation protein HypE [Microbulbifer flavimaris]|uniref:Hydrogenase expression/formation protein HypE n=2 Tax=Microbulbiferaceae TaxID=1706373 RepID=A0ABX4I3U5_9GAMM|nr:hydrogenase expression/formation protein HypE [Microbulbifer flavimaris]